MLRFLPPKTCTVEDCDRDATRRAMCEMHYRRWMRTGRTGDAHPRPAFATVEERFWSKVDVQGPDECWLWTGALNDKGYGRFSVDADNGFYAHIWSYTHSVGPVPEGMTLDHECHNAATRRAECAGGPACVHRRCVNPAHLVPRTAADNTNQSMNSPGNRTHCPSGHPYAGANLRINATSGARQCRTCGNEQDRARYRDLLAAD